MTNQNEQPTTTLFALYERSTDAQDRKSYAVAHPASGEPCSALTLKNGYCEQPLTLPLAEAKALAESLRLRGDSGSEWVLEAAPGSCPCCGRQIWADDLDFCYPRNRERTEWRARCNKHDFGCGHEVLGASFDEVMAKWNTGAVD